jgi:tRNA nucleotidyltransferase (CCA-adding enzyme)
MSPLSFPPELREFALVFKNAGKSCYIVGGAVRDLIIGKSVSDYDAATDARPEEVMRLFRRVVPTGIKHGTVTVMWKGKPIETTTFRRESGYADGRHPDEVEYGASLEEDLSRRDFTINALAYEPLEEKLVDLYGGQADLGLRLIRAVGNPAERFAEDGLRPLRAVRFASQLGFKIEPETLAAIPSSLERFKLVSPERVREELEKILRSPEPSTALRLMEETGMLAIVLPELMRCRGVEQKGMHRFDVLDHLYASVDAAPADPVVRLAALLHDIGKPETKAIGADGIATFYGHEALSAREAAEVMRRLRFPNATTDEVAHLVRQHMFFYEDSWTDAAVRRFLARVGEAEVERLFALRLADGSGMTGIPVPPESLEPLRRRIARVLAEKEAFKLKDLAIGGNELASLGVPKGPAMGRILAELLETVLDDPKQNTREKLMEIAEKTKAKYGA